MKLRKLAALLCAGALVLTMTACSQTSENTEETTTTTEETTTVEEDYSNQTLTGEITSIDGTTVTLTLGELTEAQMGGDNMQDGQAPSDNDSSNNGSSDSSTPPEMPSGDTGDGSTAPSNDDSSDSNTPPEMPSGDNAGDGSTAPSNGGSSDSNTPPEKPDGDNTGDGSTAPSNDDSSDSNTPPEMPSGDTGDTPSGDNDMQGGSALVTFTAGDETATIDLSDAAITKDSEEISTDDLSVGDVLVIEFGDNNTITAVTVQSIMDPNMGGNNMNNGSQGGSSDVDQGSSATTITEDGTYSDTTYTSTGDDENALRVDGATVTLDGIDVEKTDGATSNTENGDFYGVNAGLLATNGATVTITNATVNTTAQNGNGVFSYGSGTTVNISNSTITTTADNSGGIQTTGGGTTNATDLTVTTAGNSSAAIRSDRGGGTVNVDGGTYTSNGYNSPAVYSTASITVKNAELTANNSEALVIEGQNSITLENCDVYGNMSDTKGTSSDENVHNIMIYQSMSGDAESGTSEFSMTGGTLTSNNGDMIYVTNTNCILTLSGVTIDNKDADGYLLNICGNSASHGWGTAGANGAHVEFTADAQELTGNIIVDTISSLNMTLSNGSNFTGTINIVDNADNGVTDEYHAVVTIDSGCTWTLTGNCTISSLTNNGTINFNGYTITLEDGTVLSK